MSWTVSTIYPFDQKGQQQLTQLLTTEGIQKDANLDYSCGIYDDNQLVATGSCYGNTLRCLAVDQSYQGEGFMNLILSHLTTYQFDRGHRHLFLYTKPETAQFFSDLGFYEIVRSQDIVFLENKKNGFHNYLDKLEKPQHNVSSVAAVVMNANPFTLGHLYLIEKAAQENDLVHLFIVSEDSSLVPFTVRKKLVKSGTAHLDNLIYHDTDSYMISQSTFPSYFQKDSEAVIRSQAAVDLHIFSQIAKKLGIQKRYVGEEPHSMVTNLYNQVMSDVLPQAGISFVLVPRKAISSNPISASTVRQLIQLGDFESLKNLVPESTLAFFKSPEAAPIIANIKAQDNVVHY
ncbi:[citrate (pro-3S)-lyase] ligase [Streptococcus moroccensis]|uniref:[Citrate [pro-3S]-lyase] ligase n=1 Tax=Streptococcus moroccensis TaxID=1451356 RepID=A0ABT9YSS5_9STRE|nr:[citrate (pro-3S)-lyase] ligase [Streptococcus moroccensis]MDQ0222170.1 [citrate (pro-3S)-lyase] ligase [Streptococcus moroccensis]